MRIFEEEPADCGDNPVLVHNIAVESLLRDNDINKIVDALDTVWAKGYTAGWTDAAKFKSDLVACVLAFADNPQNPATRAELVMRCVSDAKSEYRPLMQKLDAITRLTAQKEAENE